MKYKLTNNSFHRKSVLLVKWNVMNKYPQVVWVHTWTCLQCIERILPFLFDDRVLKMMKKKLNFHYNLPTDVFDYVIWSLWLTTNLLLNSFFPLILVISLPTVLRLVDYSLCSFAIVYKINFQTNMIQSIGLLITSFFSKYW